MDTRSRTHTHVRADPHSCAAGHGRGCNGSHEGLRRAWHEGGFRSEITHMLERDEICCCTPSLMCVLERSGLDNVGFGGVVSARADPLFHSNCNALRMNPLQYVRLAIVHCHVKEDLRCAVSVICIQPRANKEAKTALKSRDGGQRHLRPARPRRLAHFTAAQRHGTKCCTAHEAGRGRGGVPRMRGG